MSTTQFQCQNCGKPILSVEAVCTDCEERIRAELDSPAGGKYRCPVCEQRFARPREELWPRGARWYVPRQFKPSCPHCHSFLRDRRNPVLPAHYYLLLIGAAVIAQFFLPTDYAKASFALLIVIYLVLLFQRRERNVETISRFFKDEEQPFNPLRFERGAKNAGNDER
jgi:hypothetical protein